MESYLNVVVREGPDGTVVTVAGELDMVSSPRLREAIGRLCASNPRSIVLDLADLEFMDISGVRVLLQAQDGASSIGARLTLVNVRRGVRRVLKLTGAEKLLRLIDESPPGPGPAPSGRSNPSRG